MAKILVLRAGDEGLGRRTATRSTPVRTGWIGLSEITAIGDGGFIVIERDNQFGDGAIKTLEVLLGEGPHAGRARRRRRSRSSRRRWCATSCRTLQAPGGYVLDKIEGFTIDAAGNAFVVTDNDGVDGSVGRDAVHPARKADPLTA